MQKGMSETFVHCSILKFDDSDHYEQVDSIYIKCLDKVFSIAFLFVRLLSLL